MASTRVPVQWFGPGLIMAVSGIGASDIISATVGGATFAHNSAATNIVLASVLLLFLVLGAIEIQHLF